MERFQMADLFSGMGGVTSGAHRELVALGYQPDIVAINHWELAVRTHQHNHPFARHYCRKVEDVYVGDLTPDRRLDLLWASPDCDLFTKARAGRAVENKLRSTAWIIPHFANQLDIRNIAVENVPEFELWGPIDPKTGRPIKEEYGRIFRAFVEVLRCYDYHVEWRKLNCAHYGDPQNRIRLFMLASRDPIKWPAPTHGPGLLPFNTVRGIVQWSTYAGDSVAAKRRAKLLKSSDTFAAIEAGLGKYRGEPFLLRRPQHDNPPESNARSIDEPIHTITSNATDIALITPSGSTMDRCSHRQLNVLELQRGMSFPDSYAVFGNKREQVAQIGNAVPTRTAGALVRALVAA